MAKRSMKVSIATQLGSNPALLYACLKTCKHFRGIILSQQSVEYCLRGKHAALNRGMNSFQACGVKKAGAVTDD
jgi:hypothetical protein